MSNDGGSGNVARKHYMELSIHPVAASFARLHVERVLVAWGLAELIDVAQLIASELVTNVIKAAESVKPTDDEIHMYGSFAETLRYVWVGLYEIRDYVVIEVWDASREPPELKTPALDEEGGRGIQLVEMLAAQWGYRWPRTGGKIVWACLALDAA
ncbi:ATP-binding protein [Nonomuraea glycinis]|uniref:ATP-binding protein n=1 Tax=Nonomuraea glycinis TaxID=2047744 RepID=UPI002E1437C8|nr:ATP-binding protein [Nonomuraea glycinis]